MKGDVSPYGILYTIPKPKWNSNVVGACLTYMACSSAMILSNKYLGSGTARLSPTLSVALQSLWSVVLCQLAARLKLLSLDTPLDKLPRKMKRFLPLSICFSAMMLSSFLAVGKLSVATMTVVKNMLTNTIIVIGDWVWHGNQPSLQLAVSLLVMACGSIAPVFGDAQLSTNGLQWAVLNCGLTAAYVLTMRSVSQSQKQHVRVGIDGKTQNNNSNNNFEQVYYNNLFAAIMLLFAAFMRGEFGILRETVCDEGGGNGVSGIWCAVGMLVYALVQIIPGVLGLLLNIASVNCVTLTSATTYAVVGSLNKMPTIALGVLLLGDQVSLEVALSAAMSVVGALLYSLSPATHTVSKLNKKH